MAAARGTKICPLRLTAADLVSLHLPQASYDKIKSLRLQLIAHILSFAFIMVIASTALMTPLLLYVLGLKDVGWHWQHAALFSSMVAPTDAVAVSTILKGGE